jgi:hypothetical protein
MPRSTGHLAPHAKTAPPIPGLRPTKTLHPGTSPYHMYLPQVPLSWETPREHPPARLVLTTRRRSYSVDSTLTTHPRRTPRSPHIHYQVIIKLSAPRALSHYASHSPASHHKYNASKSKAVHSKRASSLTVGVQGNRLRQGNGSQAIYHASCHHSFA